MSNQLTPQEKELSSLVKTICGRKDTYMGVMLAASIYGFVDETLGFIKSNPGIEAEELIAFVCQRVPEEDEDEEYDENYLEPCD